MVAPAITVSVAEASSANRVRRDVRREAANGASARAGRPAPAPRSIPVVAIGIGPRADRTWRGEREAEGSVRCTVAASMVNDGAGPPRAERA